MKTKNIISIIAVFIVICIIGGLGWNMWIFGKTASRNKTKTQENTNLTAYAEELTGLVLDDICTEGIGEIKTSGKEENAYICLSLKADGEEKIRERLEQKGLKPFDGTYTLPGFQGHEIAKKLKSETILDWYTLFLNGNGETMTRSVELYLTKTEDGKLFLYLFG